MDAHPFVDAVEDVRVRIRRGGGVFVRRLLGMALAPVHAQPKRYRKTVVRLIWVEELEVLVLANQVLESRSVNNARLA